MARRRLRSVLVLPLLCVLTIPGCGSDDDSGNVDQPDITVVDLNILHGLTCAAETESCRLADRIELLFQWIVASGCPDVVTLQEIWRPALDLIPPYLESTCPFPYQAVMGRQQV